jgi:AraC-like DNA-binding protein
MKVIQHSSVAGCWEWVIAKPHPALRAYVTEYVGGFERPIEGALRREVPADIAPVIFNFGPRFRLSDPRTSEWLALDSFVAGAFDSYVLAGATGPYEALQVNFTLLGLRVFVGHAIHDLSNRMVPLRDVFGADGDRLADALYATKDWGARVALFEREVFARLAKSTPVPRPVAAAYHRLTRSGGCAAIREIAEDVGWSHKHLIARFTEHIGLPPKVFARVLRFGRAAEMLRTSSPALADVALECGYYDQAHFARDFRAFAGVSATELVASQLPDRGGFTSGNHRR